MFDKVLFGAANDNWATPREVFEPLNAEFCFTLDPCCRPHTAKCAKFYTPDEDGLSQDWSQDVVFMNPPYGRLIGKWMKKAFEEAQAGAIIVCLVPARTDTRWWHQYCMKSSEIRFFNRRIGFLAANDNAVLGSKANATFPSAVVVFRPNVSGNPKFGIQSI